MHGTEHFLPEAFPIKPSDYSAGLLRAIISGLLKNYRSKSVCTLIRAKLRTIK